MANDKVLGFLGGIVDAAVAPVIATCEIISDGKVSSKTTDTLVSSIAKDGLDVITSKD